MPVVDCLSRASQDPSLLGFVVIFSNLVATRISFIVFEHIVAGEMLCSKAHAQLVGNTGVEAGHGELDRASLLNKFQPRSSVEMTVDSNATA
jgi:hypothetical protein